MGKGRARTRVTFEGVWSCEKRSWNAWVQKSMLDLFSLSPMTDHVEHWCEILTSLFFSQISAAPTHTKFVRDSNFAVYQFQRAERNPVWAPWGGIAAEVSFTKWGHNTGEEWRESRRGQRRGRLCGPRHWQVQRLLCQSKRVCVRVHAHKCVGVCVGAGESCALHWRGERDIEWESREKDRRKYGLRSASGRDNMLRQWLQEIQAALKCQISLGCCFSDHVFVLEHLTVADLASDFSCIPHSAERKWALKIKALK